MRNRALTYRQFARSVLLLLVLSGHCLYGQRQNEWHFGGWNCGIGLRFSTNPPTVVPTSYTGATGSGASITDHNGNLLFYTDGSRVWDRQHNLMTNGNGLVWTGSCDYFGTLSQRDGMIIQPVPFDSNRYYIFSIPYAQCMDPSGQGIYYPSSLYYSVVDMRLNSGLGDVVASEKGILIDQGLSSGGICIVPGNHCDYWLLAHTYYLSDNPYYLNYMQIPPDTVLREQGLLAYHITENGIDPDPVHTPINDIPYLKQDVPSNFIPIVASHDRSKLLVMNLLGKFDPETGRFSDYFRLFQDANFISYGCGIDNASFSPNDKKLYVSAVIQDGWGKGIYDQYQGIFQFDLSELHYYPVRKSRKMVYSQYSGLPEPDDWRSIGQVRLTPHNELYFISRVGIGYFGSPFRDHLNTITNPDADFKDLVLREDIIDIGPDSVHYGWGLPTPVQYKMYITDTVRQTYTYLACKSQTLSLPGNAINVVWENGAADRSRIITDSGVFRASYQLPHERCRVYADSFTVRFPAWNNVLLVVDTACAGRTDATVTLQHGLDLPIEQTFTWLDANDNILHRSEEVSRDSLSGIGAGDYRVRISLSNGCDTVLRFRVTEYPAMSLDLRPGDTVLRYGDSLYLRAGAGFDRYTWDPLQRLLLLNDSAVVVYPVKPAVYNLTAIDKNGCEHTGNVHVDIDYNIPDLIPNAFTPNGDGRNDVFRVEGLRLQKVVEFKVFNRFGEAVCQQFNADAHWDGSYKGMPCDMGTYYYLIRLAYPDGRVRTYKGDVVLIR